MLQNSLSMRFVFFNTPTPKRFTYKPRYYDEEKDRLEQRKAELGLNSELSPRESLRFQIRKRWSHQDVNSEKGNLRKYFYYAFYGFVAFGGVYLIFFTDFVDKLVALFGVGK